MAETVLHRHPVRGALWGLVFGVGGTLLLMVFSIVPLSIPNLIISTAIFVVVSVAWSVFAPPKKPSGPPPAAQTPPPPAPAEG
jgi:sulfite exporter TauE/SafE